MKYFVDGGPAQQVTQFQPTFSPAQQGIGSLQQAPNIPAMEGSPTDYSAAPTQQYTPTTSYSAPAAMTAGLGSYMEGLQYKAPAPMVYTAGAVGAPDDTTSPSIYDPVTQTYKPNPRYVAPAVTPSNRRVDTTGGSGSGGGSPGEGVGDFGGYGGMSGDQSGLGATSVGAIGSMGLGEGDYGATSGDTTGVGAIGSSGLGEGDYGAFGGDDYGNYGDYGGIDGGYGGDGGGGDPGGGGDDPGGGFWDAGGRIHSYAQGGSIPQGIASLGRGQDSMLVHMTPGEVQGLQRLAMSQGGSLTINPQTGLPEAGFLSSMLPMLASAAAVALAPATMGASTVALLGAGAGAATGYLTNKQSPLMGAVMGGISGYGMGSIGEGLSAAGTTSELNAAAEMGKRATGIDELVKQAADNPDAVMTPGAYRQFLTEQVPSTVSSSLTPADLTAFKATDAGKVILAKNNMGAGLQGLMPGADNIGQNYSNFIGQTAKDSVTGKATGLGGGLAATAKGLGLAAPLISSALTPNKFVPPPIKPPMYYKTSYNQPQYDPTTGTYKPASYGPGSYSTAYGAEGGAVGYAEGGEPRVYPHTGDPIANTGGYGGRGEKPQYSRDIYGDEAGEGPYGDAAGEGPYDDKEGRGVYSNTKLDKSTPAKRVLAARKAYDNKMKLKYLLQNPKQSKQIDDTEYAAEGGLMGLHTYAAGGRLLRGPGDGMSDSIPAVIKGARPQRAALADGEFVIPADVVSHLGNGSTEAGSKRLYSMMDKVRKARTGNPKQGKQINPARFMPA
jgi:hypothetical protein